MKKELKYFMKNSEIKFYHNTYNQHLKALVKDLKLKTDVILDVGIGNGENIQIFDNSLKLGITLSEREKAYSRNIYNEIYVHNLELGLPKELLTQKVDLIICSHVLEHIAYPEKLIKDIFETMHEDSHMVITVPNLMFYRYRLTLLSGRFPQEDYGIWDYTHLRWYTLESLKAILNDFKIIKIIYDVKIPLGRISNKFPISFKNILLKIFRKISPQFFSTQFTICVSKK